MQILVTGSGSSGSWQIRGLQLGAAIGATVQENARDIAAHDVAVVVKRPPPDLVQRIRRAGVPLVWDVVDSWPQPAGNDWSRAECMVWLESQLQALQPLAVVAATEAMAQDVRSLGYRAKCVPHHARPNIERNPIRDHVKVVGYEGGVQYVARWKQVIDAECARRGWRFQLNPPSLACLDIVLALRDATGYAPRAWKSGVKVANAQGSGTPVICCREAGYLEQATGRELWADSAAELSAAFDALTPHAAREAAADMVGPRLVDVARDYKAWLMALKS